MNVLQLSMEHCRKQCYTRTPLLRCYYFTQVLHTLKELCIEVVLWCAVLFQRNLSHVILVQGILHFGKSLSESIKVPLHLFKVEKGDYTIIWKYCILSLQSDSLKNTDTSVKKCCYMFDRMYLNGMLHPAKKNVLKRFEFTHIYGTPCAQRIVVIQARDTLYVKIVCVYYISIHTHQKHT